MRIFTVYLTDRVAKIVADEWSIENNILYFYKKKETNEYAFEWCTVAVFSMSVIAGFVEKDDCNA